MWVVSMFAILEIKADKFKRCWFINLKNDQMLT